jgi:hypothetical protein
VSNKENKSLSESFLKAFGIKSHQVFGEHIIHEETERQALERKSRLLEQKLKAAKNGGFGDLRKLKEERDAVMYQLSTLAEDELSEDKKAMMAAGKEMEAYARKNGGIDKNDFMKAAMMMKKGEIFKLQKFIDELDTEPREKIISVVQSHMKEELGEAKNYEIKNDKVYISKANFRKVHKDFKNSTKGKERMMALDPKTGGTASFPVVFTEMKASGGDESESADAVTPAGGKADDEANKKTSQKMEKIKEGIEGSYDKAFDSKELAEKFAGAVGGIVREMSGKFYVFNKEALQEAASIELAKKVKDLDDETDEKKQEAELDKVDPKQAKKKFKDRDDKDIDNDGDVDKSDEYLHKRRKAISKAVSKEKEETKESVELDENVNALAKEFEKRITKGGALASDRIQDKERMAVLAMGKKKGVDMKALDAAIIKVMNTANEEVDTSDVKKLDEFHAPGMEPKGRKKAAPRSTKKSLADIRNKADNFKKEEVELEEKVNVKAIQKAVDDGKSMDVIMTMFANKRTTNTDEIRKVVKDYMWKKRMKKEEVELDEAKSDYETGHKDFSSAVQHAKAVVQKRGYEIEGEDWDKNVALGPRKPSKGKTNSYHIPVQKKGKTKKEMLHMQVYNDGNRYELNMYIQ